MNMTTSQNQRWLRAKNIVADAMELPIDERNAFIEKSVARDEDREALRFEVISLLAEDTGSGSDVNFKLRAPFPDYPEDTKRDGEMLGAWRLKNEIGRGGMGVVYLAERADGAYQQQVAIKLLTGASAQDGARLARERQALATLTHPNVARLIDGGNATNGAPYLVMEYVEGIPIDQFCRQQNLNLRERIKLVRGVCAAVQSAHQQLLIHRDVKPANILVTSTGEPKLLDFGIARLLEPNQLDGITSANSAHTFTPRYASPEQVLGQPVTTATDVYGLGLLLYELLGGSSPYIKLQTRTATTPAEAMAAVIRDEPRKVSEVLRTSREDTSNQISKSGVISKHITADLDTILLKAAAKTPVDRYQTVAQLDDDLARFLDGRPVLARAQSAPYRAWKFVCRHPIGVSLGGAAIGAIAVLFTLTLIQKSLAESRFNDLRALSNAFIYEHYDAIRNLPGAAPVVAKISADNIKYLDKLAATSARDPKLGTEVSSGYLQMSTAFYNDSGSTHSGNKPAALDALAKSKRTLENVLANTPNYPLALVGMGRLAKREAQALGAAEKQQEALAKFDESIAFHEKVLQLDPKERSAIHELTQSLLGAAPVATSLSKSGDAYILRAAEALRVFSVHYPNDDQIENLRLAVVGRQYLNAQMTKNWSAALIHINEEIVGYDAYLKNNPNDFLWRSYLSIALNNKTLTLNELKRHDEALQTVQRGLALDDQMLIDDPSHLNSYRGRARKLFHYGKSLYALGCQADALQQFRLSADAYDKVLGKPSQADAPRAKAESLLMLARVSHERGERSILNTANRDLNALATAYPEPFTKKPTTLWVEEVRQLTAKR